MRRSKNSVRMLMAPLAIALTMSLGGCVAGVDYGGGPEWDGGVVVVGGGVVGGGYYGGGGRNYHPQAFRSDGGRRPVVVQSARGRASMGVRAGGGHTSSGGDRR
jgi:hypothetical protein